MPASSTVIHIILFVMTLACQNNMVDRKFWKCLKIERKVLVEGSSRKVVEFVDLMKGEFISCLPNIILVQCSNLSYR